MTEDFLLNQKNMQKEANSRRTAPETCAPEKLNIKSTRAQFLILEILQLTKGQNQKIRMPHFMQLGNQRQILMMKYSAE